MFRPDRVSVSVMAFILGLTSFEAGILRGQGGGAPVVINELLASNSGNMYSDPQGEAADWFELYNPGDSQIDIGGMYLTDDLLTPTKWQIPTGKASETTIAPQGYLVIWADKDVTDTGLHASFSLDASGEEIGLFDKDGVTLIDSIVFGQQMTDVSYGRYPDGNDTWVQMPFPNPGIPNFIIYQGIVKKPKFNFDHGFFDREFSVAITCPTEGAMIYYTIDGTDPYSAITMRPSATASLYSVPVRINKTTCLRATGIKIGWYASAIETRTYIFIADVIQQSPTGASPGRGWPTSSVNGQTLNYGMDPDVVNDPRYKDLMNDALLAIPTISLVTDPANLFDVAKGIYVNARNQGLDWERPVSAELIYPDGTEGFQIDAGLRIRGGYSRTGSNPKHAFRLFFRTEYGSPVLKYPLFGDEGVDEFETVDLRTGQNYSWSFEGNQSPRDTFVREVFSRDTQRDMGRPYTRSRYYHLYIDGQYWGLFQTQERSEASYAESYFGPAKEDYDVVKSRAGNGGYDIEATDGTLDAWRRLWDASVAGFDDATYYRVQGLNPNGTPNPAYEKLLDVDNLIDYMLCTYYVGDPDGPVSAWALVCNNFYGIYNRVHPEGFIFFRHDAEHSLYDLYESRLFAASTLRVGQQFNQSNPLWMHTHLILHPEYRMRFADRAYQHFFNGGVLTPQPCMDRFMARAQEIDMAIIAESARWGDSKTSKPRTRDDDWLPDINGMVKSYFPQRTTIVLNQLKSQGWYPNVDPPALTPLGGHVATGSAAVMQSSNDVYYTLDGSDPRLPEKAVAAVPGQIIVAENAAKRALVPTGDVSDAWKGGSAFDDSTWKSATGGPGGVGYERSSGYQSLISIDVRTEMYSINTSCYIRIPFNLASDPSKFTSLTLNVRYDDGFIAYLNGTEVHRAGFSGTPSWNSASELNREADTAEPFNISDHVDLLRPGQNVLAIHGLNVTRTSSDFLITASLEAAEGSPAQGGGIAPTAVKYTGPVALDRSTHVKARARSGNVWSALNEAVFAVGAVRQSLRISEVMFHPAD
ncbi:MAG: chitobiase/beta-hexosaminidase C-terminal domain-containing protein, partial [Sedimentisphaerales bacterium]|nr:chitobiase/beta-hexosaminidase C-terminal domain-containing protein [Sedimentisphaerales bacterium]